MHEQRSPCVAQDEHATEQAILGLLAQETAPLWAIEELVREIGDRLAVVDAVRRLQAAGLAHDIGGEYVFISRTARRVIELWE
jgi:hypothetical protein